MKDMIRRKTLQFAHLFGMHSVLGIVRCAYNYIIYRKANTAFKAAHPDYATPPLGIMFDACGHTNYELYRNTGIEFASFVAQQIKEYATAPNPVCCEWGCGPGRIIRHLAEQLGNVDATLVATDCNPASVLWCRENVPGIRFETNQLSPPLPFSDGSIDFLFARSVFTHLDKKGWHEWWHEIGRLMSDGGVVLITTAGSNYLPMMTLRERELFLAGEPVFRTFAPLGKKNYAAFHPADYVRSTILPEFEILSQDETADLFGTAQDIWVLRKKLRQSPGQVSSDGSASDEPLT